MSTAPGATRCQSAVIPHIMFARPEKRQMHTMDDKSVAEEPGRLVPRHIAARVRASLNAPVWLVAQRLKPAGGFEHGGGGLALVQHVEMHAGNAGFEQPFELRLSVLDADFELPIGVRALR